MKNLFFLALSIFLFNGLIAQNNSLDFDGTDDYVNYGDIDALDGAGQLTIEGWFNLDNLDNNSELVTKQPINSNDGNHPGFGFKTGPGARGEGDDLYFYSNVLGNGAGSIEAIWTNNNALTGMTGAWHHFAVVFDGSLSANIDRVKFYIDGVEQTVKDTRGTMEPATYAASTANMTMGAIDGGTGGIFEGKMDDIRIWGAAKTQAEIQASMNTEIAGTEANLVAYYKMDSANDPCGVVDCHIDDNHGTRVGATGTNDTPQYSTDVPSLTDVACGNPYVSCLPIPTMGEWALIILGLIVLSFGVVYVMRWSKTQQYAKAY